MHYVRYEPTIRAIPLHQRYDPFTMSPLFPSDPPMNPQTRRALRSKAYQLLFSPRGGGSTAWAPQMDRDTGSTRR